MKIDRTNYERLDDKVFEDGLKRLSLLIDLYKTVGKVSKSVGRETALIRVADLDFILDSLSAFVEAETRLLALNKVVKTRI